jgi:hypothetical protein
MNDLVGKYKLSLISRHFSRSFSGISTDKGKWSFFSKVGITFHNQLSASFWTCLITGPHSSNMKLWNLEYLYFLRFCVYSIVVQGVCWILFDFLSFFPTRQPRVAPPGSRPPICLGLQPTRPPSRSVYHTGQPPFHFQRKKNTWLPGERP